MHRQLPVSFAGGSADPHFGPPLPPSSAGFSAATMTTPKSTKQVAEYTLTERIGTGSFATVFKAHPTVSGPDAGIFVAVKVGSLICAFVAVS